MRRYPVKLSTFFKSNGYLYKRFLAVFCWSLGPISLGHPSFKTFEESRLTVDRRNRRSIDHLLGIYE